MAEEDNKDHCVSQRQIKSNKWEQLKGKEQETDTQNTQDVNSNPTIMGNNNKESIASLSELLFSHNLIADAERKDDAITIDLQTNCNSIDPFSEVLNNQNLITGTETKEDQTTIGMQFNYDSIDFLVESLTHHSAFIIEEDENDMATKNNIINNNNNESLVVGIDTTVGKQAQITQKKKRKWDKNKK